MGCFVRDSRHLIRGQSTDGRKTLSQIEAKRYEERSIRVRNAAGEEVGPTTTFVVRADERRAGLWTSFDYVQHIVQRSPNTRGSRRIRSEGD